MPNLQMLDNNCDEPFFDDIWIDSSNKISAVTDFVGSWKDPVCIVCKNIYLKFKLKSPLINLHILQIAPKMVQD